jgi:hypothetical protein
MRAATRSDVVRASARTRVSPVCGSRNETIPPETPISSPPPAATTSRSESREFVLRDRICTK